MKNTHWIMGEYDKLRHNNLGEAGYTSYKFDLMSEVVGIMREASKVLGVNVCVCVRVCVCGGGGGGG